MLSTKNSPHSIHHPIVHYAIRRINDNVNLDIHSALQIDTWKWKFSLSYIDWKPQICGPLALRTSSLSQWPASFFLILRTIEFSIVNCSFFGHSLFFCLFRSLSGIFGAHIFFFSFVFLFEAHRHMAKSQGVSVSFLLFINKAIPQNIWRFASIYADWMANIIMKRCEMHRFGQVQGQRAIIGSDNLQ